jgi:MFS family permease
MRLWRNQAFVVFWSARTISFAGTGITMIVLPVLVYGMTHSPAWVASLALIEAVPYLSFGLLAGAVADRVNRKKIMVACELGGLVSAALVPVLIKRLAIGRLAAAFLIVSAAALAFLVIAPSYGWALLAFFLFELAYVMVTTTGITLTPDHLQARVNTAGRMIAGGGLPVGAVLAGLLAESLPIQLVFGLLTISAVVGAGFAGWSCLGSRPLAAVSVSVSAPGVHVEGWHR